MENMLILESREKNMEDGLLTKDGSFLVYYIYLIHWKAWIRKDKDKICKKVQLLNIVVNKVGMI